MNEYCVALDQAKNAVKIADHMLKVTYNVVNDPKLLMVIAERLLLAMEQVVKAIVMYEVQCHRIPPFKEEFDEMFSLFKMRCTGRYNIDSGYVDLLQEIKEVVQHHKQSPVEFSRKEEYVICSENYETDIISKTFLNESVAKIKLFIEDVEKMLIKNQITAASNKHEGMTL